MTHNVYMEKDTCKEYLYDTLWEDYNKLEGEITDYRSNFDAIMKSRDHPIHEAEIINNSLVVPTVEKYSKIFTDITSSVRDEFLDPTFRELYGLMALSIGYMNIQIKEQANEDSHTIASRYAETIRYYDLAEVHLEDSDSRFLFNLVSTQYRSEITKLFPSYKSTLLPYLLTTARQLLDLFIENSTEELLLLYLGTKVPSPLLIEALESISAHDSDGEKCKYAALAYLHARSGNLEESEAYVNMQFNTKGDISHSLYMFMSDIYKCW